MSVCRMERSSLSLSIPYDTIKKCTLDNHSFSYVGHMAEALQGKRVRDQVFCEKIYLFVMINAYLNRSIKLSDRAMLRQEYFTRLFSAI